jgi:hypothetical protein
MSDILHKIYIGHLVLLLMNTYHLKYKDKNTQALAVESVEKKVSFIRICNHRSKHVAGSRERGEI